MIKVTLSSAAMGNVDEADFDIWAEYVNEKIDDVAGETVQVDQARFGEAGGDRIVGATEAQVETIRRWLANEGWEAFCGAEWDARRKAHDAA